MPIPGFTDTQTMLEALEQKYVPKMFLLDTIFSKEEKSMSEFVTIDIIKGHKKLAPFVRPIDKSKKVDRIGYKQNVFRPPYIKQHMVTNAGDFLKRMAGQTIYAGSNPAQRAAQQLGQDLTDLQNLIMRREEEMASQVLTTGKCVIKGDGIDEEIDFGMDAISHVVTASTLWSAGGADPLEDLRGWVKTVAQDSGIVPNICIMGFDAVSKFLDNTKIQKLLDLRRVDIGQINPALLPSGASFVGTLRTPGLYIDIYTYDDNYTDDAGVNQYFVPTKKVIIGNTNARATRHYGAIQDVEFNGGAMNSVRWFPKSWVEPDPSAQFLMLQSAPLPCMHQPDAFFCATVLS